MRVLVTGIDGFVGSHAAEFLLAAGNIEVHGTVLDPGAGRNLAHLRDRVHLHQADVVDQARIAMLFAAIRPDRVIHLAGQAYVPTSRKDPAGTVRVNVMGGVAILEAARLFQEQTGTDIRILLVSSGETYGANPPPPVTEDHPLRPLNPYAASKACLDLIGREYRRSFGMRVTVARPFNHAGPRQSPIFVASDFGRQFASIAEGIAEPTIRAGNLEARRDFTDVRDVVRAYWVILGDTSDHDVFNVCSGQVFAVGEVIRMYEDVTGIRVKVRSEPVRARPHDIPYLAGDFSRLREATGWSPTIPLQQTLADVFAYWRAEIAAPR
ncbi:MAG: GDP-mannose 4,6-dehydratase [Bacteroidota bacterium]